MVEEAVGAFDGKIVSSEPTGTLIGQSAFLCEGEKASEWNGLHYTTIFFGCEGELKKYFRCRSDMARWLTTFSTLGENAGHGSQFFSSHHTDS